MDSSKSISDVRGSTYTAVHGTNINTDNISSKQLEQMSGATYRQIDYWCRQGIIEAIKNNTPGSGRRRYFKKSTINKVKLLVLFSNGLPKSTLKEIYDNYDEGTIDLGRGVFLSWDLVEIEQR